MAGGAGEGTGREIPHLLEIRGGVGNHELVEHLFGRISEGERRRVEIEGEKALQLRLGSRCEAERQCAGLLLQAHLQTRPQRE
jgi:hypothetical protein